MTMTSKDITFIAAPRDRQATLAGTDGNVAIASVTAVLKGTPIPPILVSSLAEIASHLSEMQAEEVGTIQIIGHGAPGMLALGYYWDPTKYTDDDLGPFYLLDSNPYAYGVLENAVKPSTRVILIGCKVGSNEPSPMIARGKSLMFDLQDMWGCDVLGADDLVGPSSFVDGRYVGSAQGYVRGQWRRFSGAASAKVVTSTVDGALPEFSQAEVIAAAALGGMSGLLQRAEPAVGGYDAAQCKTLLGQYATQIKFSGSATQAAEGHELLAMNEVSFRCCEGMVAHLICDSRFLKVETADGDGGGRRIRYFGRTGDDKVLDNDIFTTRNPAESLWRDLRLRVRTSRLKRHAPGSRAAAAPPASEPPAPRPEVAQVRAPPADPAGAIAPLSVSAPVPASPAAAP